MWSISKFIKLFCIDPIITVVWEMQLMRVDLIIFFYLFDVNLIWSEMLQQHIHHHAEARPHVCEYCDAGFTTAQSLKHHLKTHTQVKFKFTIILFRLHL